MPLSHPSVAAAAVANVQINQINYNRNVYGLFQTHSPYSISVCFSVSFAFNSIHQF